MAEEGAVHSHLIFSSGVIPDINANADRNSSESTKLFW